MDIVTYTKSLMLSDRLTRFIDSGAGTKTFVLVLPKVLDLGSQKLIVQFPYDGTIVGLTAFCSVAGTTGETNIMIEKCPVNDFSNGGSWIPILSAPLTIESGLLNSSGDVSLVSVSTVDAYDYFRLNFLSVSQGAEGFTVQVTVRIFE